MEPIEGITPQMLWSAVLVLSGFCALAAILWKGLEAMRSLTGMTERRHMRRKLESELSAMRQRISVCEERLKQGDIQAESMRGDMTQMLTVLNAMLMHFISGNDHEKLRRVKDELDRYLTER